MAAENDKMMSKFKNFIRGDYMSAICHNNSLFSGIGPVTICETQMTTWRDNNQAILRLVKIAPTVNPKIMAYAFQECNQTTIKNSEEFENLVEKNLIYIFTTEGKLCSFKNDAIREEVETSRHIYGLLKGKETSLLKPKLSVRLINPEDISEAKAQLKSISFVFKKNVK